MDPPRPTITGPKIIRFTTPSTTRRFTVHSDLICATSRLFSSKLAAHRKPLSPTSTCSICHDVLDPVEKDIDFCKECGQNVHSGCIEGWKQQITRKGMGWEDVAQLPTCPMCRANWKDEPLLRSIHVQERLDPVAVQGYVDWLYTRKVVIPDEVLRTTDKFNVAMLKCWAVAVAMGDEAFRDEVLRLWFGEAEARFWSESVKWVFVEGFGVKEIKDFVLEVFIAFLEPGWFREESARWPEVFVRELSEKLLEGGKGRGFEEIKRIWLEKLDGGHEKRSEGLIMRKDGYDLHDRESRSSSRGKKRNADKDDEEGPQMKKKQWASKRVSS